MFVADGELIFSASDLTGYLECGLLPVLNREVAKGTRESPASSIDSSSLAALYGDRHELAYLKKLKEIYPTVVGLSRPSDVSIATLQASHDETAAALASGSDVVYQGTFLVDGWLGHPDFLIRTSAAGGFWPHSYDVFDTKLARHAKATALIQVALYAQQLENVQGCPPERLVLVLGDGSEQSFSPQIVSSYLASIRRRFIEALDRPAPYPYPVSHCAICRWREPCGERRRDDDHLSLVANMRRAQVKKLETTGIARLEDLAELSGDESGIAIGTGTLQRLTRQAREQQKSRNSGDLTHSLLDREPGRGLSLIPTPDPDDVFFDMEGFPYEDDGGLEYLFGWVTTDESFHRLFSADRSSEKQAFETFVDEMTALVASHPAMHIYHYAPYEPTALSRLATRHATREEEVANFLRHGVLVDLYQVVRQSLVVGAESYSIKAIEPLYNFSRHEEIKTADESLMMYQTWLDGDPRDPEILEKIAEYNFVDCLSTLRLRDWLLTQSLLASPPDEIVRRLDDRTPSEDAIERAEYIESLGRALLIGIPEEPIEQSLEQRAQATLAHFLKFHQREAASEWREYFARMVMTPQELCDNDSDAIGELRFEASGARIKNSHDLHYSFPLQEFSLKPGDSIVDPATDKAPGSIQSIESPSEDDPSRGVLTIRRAVSRDDPHPLALIPIPAIPDGVLRGSIQRTAEWVLANGIDSPAPSYRAIRQILLRKPPRLSTSSEVQSLAGPDEEGSDAVARLVPLLDGAALSVQGPPGSGKTYAAVQAIAAALGRGEKVGVTSNSHRVVDGVLEGVVKWAKDVGRTVTIAHKIGAGEVSIDGVEGITSNQEIERRLADGTINVVGGTAWLMAREEMAGLLDLLIVDEAGQVSLANALASSGAATNLLLVGDPAQLDQPSQAVHPGRSGVSALAYILDDEPTIPRDLGIFLRNTRRMHPAVCEFISNAVYSGQLESIPGLENQRISPPKGSPEEAVFAGAGIRYLPVLHEGNRNESIEEALRIKAALISILGGTWTDRSGTEEALTTKDVLVVAPYNKQVAVLRSVLPSGIEIGTVDKFQGREAPVVFYSMATSSSDELPREFEFLYSLNRLNVAISRAQVLAVLVCSPDLLAPRCNTTRQVELVNALCKLVDFGTGGYELIE